jgi:hypothetical protein
MTLDTKSTAAAVLPVVGAAGGAVSVADASTDNTDLAVTTNGYLCRWNRQIDVMGAGNEAVS